MVSFVFFHKYFKSFVFSDQNFSIKIFLVIHQFSFKYMI